MDFIFDKPWGMHVLFGVIASVLWSCMWLVLWLAGKFDKAPGKGFPILFLGLLPCIPFGALVCAAGFVVGTIVAVMWMLNAGFGWFEAQMIAVRGAFTKVEANPDEETETKKKSGKSRKGRK